MAGSRCRNPATGGGGRVTKLKQVLNISIVDAPLGMKWTLTIMDKTVAGGYAQNMWAALDDTNAALLGYVRKLGQE